MKKLLIFSAVIAGVTLIGFWAGKKTCMMMCQGPLKPNPYCHFALDLNPQQAQSLEKMESGFRKDADKICMQICKERWALVQLIGDKAASPDAINKKIEEIGAMQVSLEKEIAAHILEAQKTLTPQQSEAYLDRLKAELSQSIQKSGYGEVIEK